MSQHLKVSKKTIRDFENGDDCAFSASIAIQYADLVEARLKLIPTLHFPEESPGTFYIRNFIALHGNMRKLKQVITLIASTLTRDKYAEFVSVLRCIREAYQVSQKEMAALLSTTQSTISKFESLSLDVKLEFLILYASVFGYHISVEKAAATHDELFHFRIRQDEISKRFSKRTRISEDIYPVILLDLGILESSAALNKKHIQEELLWAKHMVNGERLTTLKFCVDYSNEHQQNLSHLFPDEAMEEITTKLLSQKLGVSERTVRRFENDDDSEASARFVFAYAALVEKDLILQPALQGPFEYLWHFYLRNCIALHGTIKSILKGSHQKSDGFPV